MTPLLLALDAPYCAVGQVLLCRTIIDHMNRELAARSREHGNTLDRFASRPHAKLLDTVSRQVCPTDPNGWPKISRAAVLFHWSNFMSRHPTAK
jgi:hypothetical protein